MADAARRKLSAEEKMRADLAGNAAQPSRISDQAVRMPDLTCLHLEEPLARTSLKQALMQPEDIRNRRRNWRQAREVR